MDCVRTAAAASRTATTAMGAPLRDGKPVVTLTIIGICVLSFALQFAVPGWTERFWYAPILGVDEPYRFLTSAFLHSTGFVGHIVFNMWALYVTGQFLEPLLGRARFISMAVLSAIGGSVAVLLLDHPLQAVVGASGMVFGLFGAMVPVLRRLGGSAAQIIGLIAVNGVIGFLVPSISWQGHLGGLVVGLALGYGFAHAPRGRQKLFGWVLPTLVAVVLLVVVLGKYAAIGVL